MKKWICLTFIYWIAFLSVYSNEPLKIDVVLEKKISDIKDRQIGPEGYTRIVNDTVYTILCYNYDTTSIYRAYDRLFTYFFKEKNISDILQKRTFSIDEIALADSLLSVEFINERKLYDYKLFSKSLYPYKDINDNYILMVSGYIRYKGLKNSIFPILYHESPDFFLAKINVSKRMIVFFR